MAEAHSKQQFIEPPIGYKFRPTDEELVYHYLIPKVANRPFPANIIYEVELKDYNPEKLTENYKPQGRNILYIFTQRDRKYKNGERPNRMAGDGYWKAWGSKRDVIHNGIKIGSKNSLVFHRGKHPNGMKTNWIMYEYETHKSSRQPRQREGQHDMRLPEWVLCAIHENHRNTKTSNDVDDESNPNGNNHHVHQDNMIQDYHKMTSQPPDQNVTKLDTFNNLEFVGEYSDFPVDQVFLNGQVSDSQVQDYSVGVGPPSSTIDDWCYNLQEPPVDPLDKLLSSLHH